MLFVGYVVCWLCLLVMFVGFEYGFALFFGYCLMVMFDGYGVMSVGFFFFLVMFVGYI